MIKIIMIIIMIVTLGQHIPYASVPYSICPTGNWPLRASADSHVVLEQCNEENPKGPAFCALEVTTIGCCQLEIRGE